MESLVKRDLMGGGIAGRTSLWVIGQVEVSGKDPVMAPKYSP